MKTKHILKIGIFSITLFALLISPILKSNTVQVNANGLTEEQKETIDVYIQEFDADELCKVNTDDWIKECKKTESDVVCYAQGFFVKQWCQVVKGTLEGLGKMFSAIIGLEISWILKALEPSTYGGFVNNPGVQQIWIILRNIVNALLILGFIGIAIATIVGYKKYAWKQILWKLIIVALLINFSLVISGIIVDVSNYLSGYFLHAAQGENESLAPRIFKGLGYTEKEGQLVPPDLFGENKSKIPAIPEDEDKDPGGTYAYNLRLGNFFIISFVMILVGGFAIIALLAIYLTIIFRAFLMIILLGISPVVFAAWIFPDTEKYWKMWWQQFLKWCFFPVSFAFILYLAITVMNNMKFGTEDSMTTTIIQMVLFSMFLVGGLIFSLQSGGAGSQLVIKQATKAGAVAGAFVGHKTLKGVTGSETWRKAQKRLEDSKFAPTHDIGVWMSRQPGKIRSDELKQIEENYKGRAPDQIRADMELHKTDKGRMALGVNTLIGKESLDYKKDDKFIEIAKNQPNLDVSGIKKIHPELHAKYFTKPEDMDKAIEQMKQKLHGVSDDEAKNRVTTNLMVEQLLKSSPDDIKSGNWEDILGRLEEKGPQHTNRFFYGLLDKNLPAGNFAAMLRSTNDTEKQTKWVQKLVKSVRDKIHGNEETVKQELKRRKYDKNRFLAEFLPF